MIRPFDEGPTPVTDAGMVKLTKDGGLIATTICRRLERRMRAAEALLRVCQWKSAADWYEYVKYVQHAAQMDKEVGR